MTASCRCTTIGFHGGAFSRRCTANRARYCAACASTSRRSTSSSSSARGSSTARSSSRRCGGRSQRHAGQCLGAAARQQYDGIAVIAALRLASQAPGLAGGPLRPVSGIDLQHTHPPNLTRPGAKLASGYGAGGQGPIVAPGQRGPARSHGGGTAARHGAAYEGVATVAVCFSGRRRSSTRLTATTSRKRAGSRPRPKARHPLWHCAALPVTVTALARPFRRSLRRRSSPLQSTAICGGCELSAMQDVVGLLAYEDPEHSAVSSSAVATLEIEYG